MLEKVYKLIDINKIHANVNQPRTVFDDEKIAELATSIKENGLIQPIIVRKENKEYKIVAGERRYRASKIAGLKQVPCVIKDYDDKQVEMLAIIENIQREDLSPIEEAKAYQALIEKYDYSQNELAKRMGKKQSTIANKIRLLKLSDEVIDAVNNRQITERHARAMLSLDTDKQEEVLHKVIDKELTVKETENLINKPAPKPKKTKKSISRNLKIALNTLNQAFEMITKSGVSLQQEVEEKEDEFVIIVKIKK